MTSHLHPQRRRRKQIRHNRSYNGRTRRGAAAIELAVCLPVMALIVYGSLTGSRMIFLRQSCVQAAYETVKESAKSTGTQANAIERGKEVLAFRNITGHTITFDPPQTNNLRRGTPITVTVAAPGNANSKLAFGPFFQFRNHG